MSGINVFTNLSARFRFGGLNIIVGRNGSGKSTLVRLLKGEVAPISGRISRSLHHTVQGESPTKRQDLIEMVDRLLFLERIKGTNTSTWSDGDTQRAKLRSELLQESTTLILDEPCVHLDSDGCMAVYDILQEIAKRGVCIVVATGSLQLAASWSDQLWLLQDQAINRVETASLFSDLRILRSAGLAEVWAARGRFLGDMGHPPQAKVPAHTVRLAAVVRDFLGLRPSESVRVHQAVPFGDSQSLPLTIISVDQPTHISWVFPLDLCDLSPHLCKSKLVQSPKGNAHVTVH